MRARMRRDRQAGFSMVELLMAAFLLAIGILGLAMLQTMSLRGLRGSRSLQTGVLLAGRMLDQIEMEGRLSWLNITDSNYTTPASLSYLQYIGKGTVYMGFDASGTATTSAPVSSKPTAFYVATVTETAVSTASTGAVSDYAVTLQFADEANKSGTIQRTVTLTRRVVHG